MSFDPLSSQGLLHALFSNLAVAEAARSCLAGHSDEVGQESFGNQFTPLPREKPESILPSATSL
jgi:hypothetical protein